MTNVKASILKKLQSGEALFAKFPKRDPNMGVVNNGKFGTTGLTTFYGKG